MPKSKIDIHVLIPKSSSLGGMLPVYWDLFARTDSQFNPRIRPDLFPYPGMGRILHGALGMATELEELLQALEADNMTNYKEEIGDFMWFYCLALKGLYPDLSTLRFGRWVSGCHSHASMEEEVAAFEVRAEITALLDRVKALIFYNSMELKARTDHGDGLRTNPKGVLNNILTRILIKFLAWGRTNHEPLSSSLLRDCLRDNLVKLDKRHRGQQAVSDQRDYEEEAQAVADDK